jgi:hypothetical protein
MKFNNIVRENLSNGSCNTMMLDREEMVVFVNLFTTIRIIVNPLELGRPSMKSMEISVKEV